MIPHHHQMQADADDENAPHDHSGEVPLGS